MTYITCRQCGNPLTEDELDRLDLTSTQYLFLTLSEKANLKCHDCSHLLYPDHTTGASPP